LVYLDNYPHWILIKDFRNNLFQINDPYIGERELSENELINYFNKKK
jgi:hypothetical protein